MWCVLGIEEAINFCTRDRVDCGWTLVMGLVLYMSMCEYLCMKLYIFVDGH